MKNPDYRLYFIADPEITNNRDIIEITETALKTGVNMLQLRAKKLGGHDLYTLALKLKRLSDIFGIPFVVNDRIDIALAVYADGVHLGQSDIPCREARRILGPDRIIGITTDNTGELERAYSDGADYSGYGAIFSTASKTDTREKNVGIEGLEKFCKKSAMPVIAIGGINRSNAYDCIKAGASGVAVISAISLADNVEMAVKQLLDEVRR